MKGKLSESAKVIFVSDAHLGGFSDSENDRVERELIALVDYAERNDFQIVILGDLFDYWMEYENYVPQIGQKLLQRFAEFNKNRETLFITGNHDNWTGGYFSELGFDVERDYRVITIGSKKVLLLHGDAVGQDLEHLKRPFLHQILRNKIFIKLYKKILMTPETGIYVMKKYSRLTGTLGRVNPEPLNRWSRKLLHKKDIDVIICGHDHVPRQHTYHQSIYLNTGAFYHHKTLVIYNNKQFELVCWNKNERKLIPFKSKHG